MWRSLLFKIFFAFIKLILYNVSFEKKTNFLFNATFNSEWECLAHAQNI